MTQVRFELKPSDPVEYGYFAVNVSGRISGSAGLANAPVELTVIPKRGGESAVEGKIGYEVAEDWKLSLKSKVEQKNLDEIVAAFKEGGGGNPVKRLAAAFGKTLGAEISHKHQIGPAEVVVGGGVELAKTPFYIFSKWSGSKTTSVLGTSFKYQVTVEGRVYVGLSTAGWWKLVDVVGYSTVRQLLIRGGAQMVRLLTFVASSTALTTTVAISGGIVGTFYLVRLGAVLTEHARREGAAKGIEAWYVSAYSAKVFHQPRPSGYISNYSISNAEHLARLMIESGEKDAVLDARQTSRRLGDRDSDSASEEEILRRHRARLESLYGGKTSMAKWHLEQELPKRAKEKLGLR